MHNQKYKTLLNNTFLLGLGTFGSKLLTFLMVRFYTGVLSPSDYGTADLIMQTANLLIPIASLGITNGVFRFALDRISQRKTVFTGGLITIVLGSAVLLLACPLLSYSSSLKEYAVLICAYTLASNLHSLCAQYVRAEGKTGLFALQGILNTLYVSHAAVIKGSTKAYYQNFIFTDFILITCIILRSISGISSEVIRICIFTFYQFLLYIC